MEINSQGIKIDKKEQIIYFKGHYTQFICGAMTMLDTLASNKILPNTDWLQSIENGKSLEGDYQMTAIKFKDKDTFDKIIKIIKKFIKWDNEKFVDEEMFIEEFKKGENNE